MDPKAIMSYYTWMKLTNGGTYVSSASLSFFFHKGRSRSTKRRGVLSPISVEGAFPYIFAPYMYWPMGVRAIKCKCDRVIADREKVVGKVRSVAIQCAEWDV